LSRRSVTGSSDEQPQHEVLEVEDDVGDVFLDALDDNELVQRLVEADLGDGRAGDRRQQRGGRRLLPSVWPKRARAARWWKLCVLPVCSPASISGRWMIA
jgi:hypothetical protein